jgi:hypothetical protein
MANLAIPFKNKNMKPTSTKVFLQTFIWFTILLSGFAIVQTIQQTIELDIVIWRSKWIVLLGLFVFNIVLGVYILLQLFRESGMRWLEKFEFPAGKIFAKLLGFLLVLFGFSLVWVARLFVFSDTLPQVTPILWIFLWSCLLQVLGLKLMTGRKWHVLFALVVLVQGVIYQIYGHLTIVTDYPFSLGYSEAGRHYYASLFQAKSIYGMQLALPFLHPTRYFLLSLPFLVNGLPLWFHRLWQVLLWIGLTAISSILLARRLSLKGWTYFFVSAWAFLYFLQGAVYYHLQICVILILAGVSARRPWWSALFIVLASVWAGASRVNWFPVPAMLGIAIYLLETPIVEKSWRYWLTPLMWGILGLLTAAVSQFVYIGVSGNADVRSFGSSFTSDLLWNRLLPNDTFPMGILPGIALVTAPLIIAFIQFARGKFAYMHPLRWGALLAMSLVLFLGGLTVSVKIGGGADLHNMDAFLLLLAIILTSFFAGCVAGEDGLNPDWGQIDWSVIAAALLVPIVFALPQISFFVSYNHADVQKDIQKLQKTVLDSSVDGGEILFVTERQLIAFNILHDVHLVPEYEQIDMMEMAMSGNREYLEKFYSDLKSHRFNVIIAEEQKFTQQKRGSFVEENKAWVRYVGAPLLCAYKPVDSLSSTNVQIFVPRPNQPSCKDPFSK